MITRFRIEGEGPTKETVIEELSSMATKMISKIQEGHVTLYADGAWECTDDVVSPVRRSVGGTPISAGYQGRMVFRWGSRP